MRHAFVSVTAPVIAGFALVLSLASPSTALVKGSRAYVEKQKEITGSKKQLAVERREADEFEKLLAALDAVRLPGGMEAFSEINADVREVMDRKYDQVRMRSVSGAGDGNEAAGSRPRTVMAAGPETVGDTGAGGSDILPRTGPSHEGRANRMKAVIVESKGLEAALAAGDIDVVPRYRYLLGEFLNLMREDLDATWRDIEEQERLLDRS